MYSIMQACQFVAWFQYVSFLFFFLVDCTKNSWIANNWDKEP